LDGGACKVGIESTIVSVIGDDWQLLRLGMIAENEIEKVAGKAAIKSVKTISENLIKVPGQHLLHYSPKTPIQLFADIESLQNFAAKNANCVALIFVDKKFVESVQENKQNLREIVTLPLNATIVAEQLYNALHTLDALQAAWILALQPPQQMDWLAINDRLTRAAHQA
jgi:L-threonylcarbamoyladenylate synthase